MKLNILIGLTILAVSSARVVREAPPTEHHLTMENLMDRIETGWKELEKFALDAAGAENTEELKQRASEHIDVITNQFNLFTDNVKQEADKLKESEMLKELRETVDKHVGDFRDQTDERIAKFKEEHPDTYSQISRHIDTLKNASSAIANKIDGLAHSDDAKNLKEASIKFIDDVKESFLSLTKDLKTEDGKKE